MGESNRLVRTPPRWVTRQRRNNLFGLEDAAQLLDLDDRPDEIRAVGSKGDDDTFVDDMRTF